MDVFPGFFSKPLELWFSRSPVCLLLRQTIPTPWHHCSTCSFLDFVSNDHHQSRQFTIAMNLYFNNYNPGHNIFELYNVLVQVRLATSKPKLDILYKKLGIRVALRVAKRLNIENLRKLRILKNSQIWVDSSVPSIPCRNKTLEIAVKTHAKVDIKLFIFCPILLDFSRIVQDCLSKQIFPHNSVHFPSNVFTFSVTSKLSPIVKKNVKEVSCVQF